MVEIATFNWVGFEILIYFQIEPDGQIHFDQIMHMLPKSNQETARFVVATCMTKRKFILTAVLNTFINNEYKIISFWMVKYAVYRRSHKMWHGLANC